MQNGDTSPYATQVPLGRYQLIRRVGRGGMGDVWLAEDPRLHRQVAIKTLPRSSQADREFSERFEREARAAAALNHPHILPVHDYGEQTLPNGQTVAYIVMPYISGGSLSDRITAAAEKNTTIPVAEAIAYLSQAAEAIDYAHAQGIVHRDIKPGNMLLRNDNWLLLADFGIARILSDQEQLTQTGVGFGTPEYMAPEQAQGKAEAASDNYSLAVIAYYLLTKQLPFSAESAYATTIQHMLTPPPSPRQFNPSLSLGVEQTLLHGLAKDPAQRPPSARAFVAELQQALTGAPFEPTLLNQPVSFPPRADKLTVPPASTGPTRRQVVIGAGIALVAVGGGLGAWALTSALNASQSKQSTTPVPTAKPTPNPNAPVLTLLGHTQPISSLAWSPSPTATTILASAGKDDQVLLWDIQAIQQGQASPTQPKAQRQFNSSGTVLLAWSPNGDKLAIGNPTINIPDLNNPDPNTISVTMFVFTSDLRDFAPGYNDHLTFPKTVLIKALTWAPGNYLITATHPANLLPTSFLLEVWDPSQPERRLTPRTQPGIVTQALTAAPDGKLAVATLGVTIMQPSVSGQTVHWSTLTPLLTFSGQQLAVDKVTWSPDGHYVAAITWADILIGANITPPSRIGVWDWKSGKEIFNTPTLPNPQTLLTTLAWSPAPTSKQLAAGAKDGNVYIWNVDPQSQTGNTIPVRTLLGVKAQVQALAWSADGQWLAAGYNDTKDSILVWRVR